MKRLIGLLLVFTMAFALVSWGGGTVITATEGDNLAESIALFEEAIESMETTDGQLLMPAPIEKEFPDRPEDPDALPEDDAGRYYDMEYVGWDATEKSPDIPESPADGSIGKRVIVIVHGDHAWTTAYERGFKMAGEALGMTIDVWSPNWDQALQDQLIDRAINEEPDAIALIPLSAENATQQFRKITMAGIPAFGTNTLTTSDAMQYMIAWTGPDDWAQMRQLSEKMAEALGGEGGVAYITHNVGTSPYYSRTFGPITQFAEHYPDIKTLDIQSPGFEAAQCKQIVSDWISRFGDDLTGIFLADDAPQATGTIDAIKEAGREDIIVVAAGNSKTGQDLVKSGDIAVINYQSAEADAGLSARTIASWFNGETVLNVGYLMTDMITEENVDSFYPTQW
ncbi:MAG TPA: substrate-binding domain-containing protein [Clostridiaceae bacterium]|jgi:ribose transport system substrate-binding protein|nr:substrate-binding domain-containing protein [Clostridiaceae bacterium]